MRILDRSVYVGPSLYAHFPVIRLELDLEALEHWPTGKLGASLRRCPGRSPARPRRTRLLVSRTGRLHPPHARGRRHLARPRARARRDRTAERRRRGRHLRQDAQHRRPPGRLLGGLRIRPARGRHRRRRTRACACCARCCPRRSAPGRQRAGGLGLARGTRRLHPLRAAPRARSVDGLAGARPPKSATSRGCA